MRTPMYHIAVTLMTGEVLYSRQESLDDMAVEELAVKCRFKANEVFELGAEDQYYYINTNAIKHIAVVEFP